MDKPFENKTQAELAHAVGYLLGHIARLELRLARLEGLDEATARESVAASLATTWYRISDIEPASDEELREVAAEFLEVVESVAEEDARSPYSKLRLV